MTLCRAHAHSDDAYILRMQQLGNNLRGEVEPSEVLSGSQEDEAVFSWRLYGAPGSLYSSSSWANQLTQQYSSVNSQINEKKVILSSI